MKILKGKSIKRIRVAEPAWSDPYLLDRKLDIQAKMIKDFPEFEFLKTSTLSDFAMERAYSTGNFQSVQVCIKGRICRLTKDGSFIDMHECQDKHCANKFHDSELWTIYVLYQMRHDIDREHVLNSLRIFIDHYKSKQKVL